MNCSYRKRTIHLYDHDVKWENFFKMGIWCVALKVSSNRSQKAPPQTSFDLKIRTQLTSGLRGIQTGDLSRYKLMSPSLHPRWRTPFLCLESLAVPVM